MAQFANAYEYFLGTTAPTDTTLYPAPNGPNTTTNLQDAADLSDDGMVTIGTGEAYYNNVAANVNLFGVTASNDPIVHYAVGHAYYLLSNNVSLTGQIGTTTTAGTFTFCFAPGTMFAAPGGKKDVVDLTIGDRICTEDGRIVSVKWVGRQTVHKLFSGAHMQPVRIRAGALGRGLPQSDLTVTADHGMVIDGLVINASALVNGSSIDWVPMDELEDRMTYYHVETEDHDVILANGAATETFVDIPGRMAFDNYQDYLDLYGAERVVPEMDRPRIGSRRLLPETIKARLGIVDEVIDVDQPLSA